MTEISFTVPSFLGDEGEFEVICEFSVTSWGGAATWMQPADPIEWEIDRILLDGEEVPYNLGHTIRYAQGWQRIEGSTEIRPSFLEVSSPIFNPLFDALAQACQEYIDENYDFEHPEPDDWEY